MPHGLSPLTATADAQILSLLSGGALNGGNSGTGLGGSSGLAHAAHAAPLQAAAGQPGFDGLVSRGSSFIVGIRGAIVDHGLPCCHCGHLGGLVQWPLSYSPSSSMPFLHPPSTNTTPTAMRLCWCSGQWGSGCRAGPACSTRRGSSSRRRRHTSQAASLTRCHSVEAAAAAPAQQQEAAPAEPHGYQCPQCILTVQLHGAQRSTLLQWLRWRRRRRRRRQA